MLRKPSSDFEPMGHEYLNPGAGKSSRLLYWWRPPIGPDDSLEIGRQMITFVIVWLLTIVFAIVVLAAIIG